MIWNSVSSRGWSGTLNPPASSSQLLEVQMSATGLGEVLLYYFRSVYNYAPQNFSLDDSESVLSIGSVSLFVIVDSSFHYLCSHSNNVHHTSSHILHELGWEIYPK